MFSSTLQGTLRIVPGPTSRQWPAQRLEDLGLGLVGVANLTEFLACQGLEAGGLDLGELVHRDDVLDGFELIRIDLLPPTCSLGRFDLRRLGVRVGWCPGDENVEYYSG